MKKIYLTTVFAAALLMTTSCGEDFLEVPRYEILEPELLASSEGVCEPGIECVVRYIPARQACRCIRHRYRPKLEHETSSCLGQFPLHGRRRRWLGQGILVPLVGGRKGHVPGGLARFCYRAISRCNPSWQKWKRQTLPSLPMAKRARIKFWLRRMPSAGIITYICHRILAVCPCWKRVKPILPLRRSQDLKRWTGLTS